MSTPPSPTSGFAPAGFFAMRTPLMPLETLIRWGQGLEAPAAEPAALGPALAADRARLRARLRAILARPEVREGLFLASADLHEGLDVWAGAPESERGQRVERPLVRYFARMAGRATPFGLFAGTSVGTLAPETRLQIDGLPEYRRHTRLDTRYLVTLAEALGRDPAVRRGLVYRPADSLYRAAGRICYIESRDRGDVRSYHFVTVEPTDYLEATLARAERGATLGALAGALASDDVSTTQAEEYVGELIDSQILVADLAVPLTGPEPIESLVAQLGAHAATAPAADRLDRVRSALLRMDAEGAGLLPERYVTAVAPLHDLPVAPRLTGLFHVDVLKPAPAATLGEAVVEEMLRGLEIFARLARRRGVDSLTRFREAFVARFEAQEVPLVEALDEEVGIGFGPAADASPLLRGLEKLEPAERTVPLGPREALLLAKVATAVGNRDHQIELEPRDLDLMASSAPLDQPDALAVVGAVAAPSADALARGDFRLALFGTMGPSGAVLLGRFCRYDAALHAQVARHLRGEEGLRPDAVFAEVVHLPEGHVGNVLSRPVLRDHEIPYVGRSGAPADRQLPVTDLRVSVRGDRVVLTSRFLDREVIPRVTAAHEHTWRTLGVYQFLGALQEQAVAPRTGWDWGPLWTAPFLPRVVSGRLVLALARWNLDAGELRRLSAPAGAERFQAVQAWRAARRLPRLVMFAEMDNDNAFPVDLDNVLSVESFVQLLKGREEATLVEVFPGPDELAAHGPEGAFVHEVVVPFLRSRAVVGSPSAPRRVPAAARPVRRTFPPGSEWLYVKLYTGPALADRLLVETIGPLAREALASGAADGWFFLRYEDPDRHLRVRFHGAPERLRAEVLSALEAAMAPLLDERRVWRVQLDTYEREVERYGGPEGVALAERLFQADSEAVLAILELLEPGDVGDDARWRVGLRGVDGLLGDLGFDLAGKAMLLKEVREAVARDLGADRALKRWLGERYRQERKGLEVLLDPAQDALSDLSPGLAVLRRRSAQLEAVRRELSAVDAAGRLTASRAELALSFVHMHVNRLLRSEHRLQELVLYSLLARHYEAQLLRRPARP